MTAEQLEKTLAPAFSPEQARLLAAVIVQSYDQLVKVSDFTELKEIVKELAIAQDRLVAAQQRTEKEIRNLARQVGGLPEAFGGSLEAFAIDLVPELLEKYWGLEVSDAGQDALRVNGGTSEFDLVVRGKLAGKPIVVLGEVKGNVTLGEVEKFLDLCGRASRGLTEEVRVIFFGCRAAKEARDRIKSSGAYMVFTHGKIL